MNETEAAERVAVLTTQINDHNKSYHLKKQQKISDEEFNLLLQELVSLETTYPYLLKSTSPTQHVGYRDGDVPVGTKMYSLDNVYNDDEMRAWLAKLPPRTALYADPKYDGESIRLRYVDGEFVMATTRGDGVVGRDVTHLCEHISFPRTLNLTEKNITIDCEFTLSDEALQDINRRRLVERKTLLVNCRSAVAGLMNSKNPRAVDMALIKVWVLKSEELWDAIGSHHESIFFLKDNGFEVGQSRLYYPDEDDLFKFHHLMESVAEFRTDEDQICPASPPMDGTVFKINDREKYLAAGFTARFPKGAIAFKFADVVKTAVVSKISYEIGRLGTITPIAILEAPVCIGDSTIEHISLYNPSYVFNLGVSAGATVEVCRKAKVWPSIRAVLKPGKEIYLPLAVCPCCQTPLQTLPRLNGDEHSSTLRCPNIYCDDVQVSRLAYATSRECLNIKGLGPKIIRGIYIAKRVETIGHLISLTQADFARTAYGIRTINNICEQLNQVRLKCLKGSVQKAILKALSIPELSNVSIDKVMQLGTTDYIYAMLPTILTSVHDLGECGLSDGAIRRIVMHAEERYEELDEISKLYTIWSGGATEVS